MRCIPIDTYKTLVLDAWNGRVMDSAYQVSQEKVQVLEAEKERTRQDHSVMLKMKDLQIKLGLEINAEFKGISDYYRDENARLHKVNKFLQIAVPVSFAAGVAIGL